LLNEAQFKKNNGHLVLGKTGGGNSGTKITNEGLRDDLV
jgi:hypothetical protein